MSAPPIRCTIRVTRSTRRGGHAVAEIDGLHSGYAVTISRERGVTTAEIATSGVLRLGPIGDWLTDMAQHLIATGCGVTAYDLTVAGEECRAVAVGAAKEAA